jgi:hypothetical protein
MASLNHKFCVSERLIFLRSGFDTMSGVLPVVTQRQHFGGHSPLRRAFCWNDETIWQFTGHINQEIPMPRGDKSSYSDKQKRMAEHIEEGYETRGVSEGEAERRAWATVNRETHGGKKSGSGRGKSEDHAPSRKGGKLGGAASAHRSAAARSASARKAARTRKKRSA